MAILLLWSKPNQAHMRCDCQELYAYCLYKFIGWETFWDTVKFTWDSIFVDALGPREAIEIKLKSNTAKAHLYSVRTNFQLYPYLGKMVP